MTLLRLQLLLFQLASVQILNFCFHAPLFAADDKPAYYDEVFDSNGEPRPHYKQVWKIFQGLSDERKAQFVADSKKMFNGDVAVHPLPRILTDVEFDVLKRGVIQRGTAIRMFLEDYFADGKQWKKAIPPEVLDRIIKRSGEDFFKDKIHPKKISFPYGPDIIRDQNGDWKVLEDNIGNIGGPGDIFRSRQILLKLLPEYKEVLDIADNPNQLFEGLMNRYRQQSLPQNGKIVIYTLPMDEEADHEVNRIANRFRMLGAEIVDIMSNKKELRVEADGVYLCTFGADSTLSSKERVGYLALSADHMHIDSAHPATRGYLLESEVERQIEMINGTLTLPRDALKKEHYVRELAILERMPPGNKLKLLENLKKSLLIDKRSGKRSITRLEKVLAQSPLENSTVEEVQALNTQLIHAILEGKVQSNYTPGIDFVGDKEFNAYVDDIVRIYLGETPILTSIHSESFAITDENGKIIPNPKLIEQVLSHKGKYVIKKVDGRGGEGIWVGPKVTQAEFQEAKEIVIKEPSRYRAQDYTHLSVAGEGIVDQRMIAHVDSQGVFVAETPFGRTISIQSDGKVNISGDGAESAIVTVKTRQSPHPVPRPIRVPTIGSMSLEDQWKLMTARIQSRFGIGLKFQKKIRRGDGLGYYLDRKKQIILGKEAYKLGPMDSGFLHEMRHAIEHWRFTQGIQSPLHIAFFSTAKTSKSGNIYQDFLSAEEVIAYSTSNFLIAREELLGSKTSLENIDIVMDELKEEIKIHQTIQQKVALALKALREDPNSLVLSEGEVFPEAASCLIRTSPTDWVAVPVANYLLANEMRDIHSSMNSLLTHGQEGTYLEAKYLAADQLYRLNDQIESKSGFLQETYQHFQAARSQVQSGKALSPEAKRFLIHRVRLSYHWDSEHSRQHYSLVSDTTQEVLDREKDNLQRALLEWKGFSESECDAILKKMDLKSNEMRALSRLVKKK